MDTIAPSSPVVPQLSAIDLVSMNIRKMSLETTEGDVSDKFDVVMKQMELPNMQDKLQVT